MPDVEVPHRFSPRPYQLPALQALDSGVKRVIAIWHRRAGKEKTFLNYTVAAMLDRVGAYYYLFPTFTQAKRVLWDGRDREGFAFMDHFPNELVESRNSTELKVTLRNGSIFQLIGTDNIDSVVGANPVGCVFSEYALQDPKAWDYLRPILRENKGWAIFDYTPRGKNHGYTLYQMAKGNPDWFVSLLTVDDTKALTPADIDAERREGMDEDLIQQEYYCSFEGVQQGSYYGKQLALAEKEGRIGVVPAEPGVGVETWWDIGVGDSNAIWFTQSVGREVLVVDYMEASGEGISFYAKELQAKPYVYLTHNGPHDLSVREWGNPNGDGRPITRLASAKAQGIDFRIVPKVSVESGIDTARAFLAKCRFDRLKCQRGLDALSSYHKEYDERLRQFRSYPCHDWSSNGADAYRYLAVGHRMTIKLPEKYVAPVYVMDAHGESNASSAWMGT